MEPLLILAGKACPSVNLSELVTESVLRQGCRGSLHIVHLIHPFPRLTAFRDVCRPLVAFQKFELLDSGFQRRGKLAFEELREKVKRRTDTS